MRGAWQRRQADALAWRQQKTDCYRVFNGTSEGVPGLTLDRYGPMALLQLFRPLVLDLDWEVLDRWCREHLGVAQLVVWQRRPGQSPQLLFPEMAPEPVWAHEMGQCFKIDAHHRGQDPHLFLDMRCARRYLRHHCERARVLNLFSYTCASGIAAEAGGASQVMNVDFSSQALRRGEENAEANGCKRQHFCCEEVYPVIWQLAGRALPARARKRPQTRRLQPRQYDLVFLDPPALAKGFFGAVDVKHDYQSLFKPCMELLAPGGRILACNNLAGISEGDFRQTLERCAAKAGRTMERIRRLLPESDFPAQDSDPPLKVLLCEFA
ncbi:MAG: class I SAM-dependent methyltransferase [Vulcanimicrobiota bacterium]